MRVALAADHAGYALKESLGAHLASRGHEVLDLGAYDASPSDYPDHAQAAGSAILDGRAERAILICGSGVGVAAAANKIPGIRAGLCHDHYSAHQGVEHDAMNVLALGARVVGEALALELADAFLAARFDGVERHARRVTKLRALEARFCEERQAVNPLREPERHGQGLEHGGGAEGNDDAAPGGRRSAHSKGASSMQIGMVGLGRMGGNMALRLLRGGHQVVGWDRSAEEVRELAKAGGIGASSLDELIQKLTPPRALWVMVPAGAATEETTRALGERLAPGDVVIDGGNSFFKDDVRRAQLLAARGIRHLDAGTSGGVFGLERGYCLMVGGDRDAFERLEPVFRTLAPGHGAAAPTPGRARSGSAEEGYLYCGPHGAGHFVKMIHNGIEYGLMQAYAEGFDVLRGAAARGVGEEFRYELDLAEIAELWRRGSVVTSWLLDLSAAALAEDPRLEGFTGAVDDSGEGRWTVNAAVEEAVPAPVLTASLYARFRSRQASTFGEKLLSAMRRQFGGHAEAKRTGGAQ